MLKDEFTVTGNVILTLFEGSDLVLVEKGNLVVDTGKALIARLLTGSGTAPSHTALGSLDTPTHPLQTTLATEIAGSRTAMTTKIYADNIATFTTIFAPGVGTGSIKEAGMFNAFSAGTMIARTTFPVFNKTGSSTLYIQWKLKVN